MKLENLLNFKNLDAKCIWLLGKNDVNADILWSASEFEYINNIEFMENVSLFDVNDFKCIYKTEFSGFLKNTNRDSWVSKLLIKGTDDVKLPRDCDAVLDFSAKFNLQDLLRNFASVYNLQFDESQWKFIQKKAKDLKDLIVFGILNQSEIELKDWDAFIEGVPASWYGRFKNNLLLQDAITNENVIPILQYFLRADSNYVRKGMVQFLLANIKNGGMIWEQNNVWKELLNNTMRL